MTATLYAPARSATEADAVAKDGSERGGQRLKFVPKRTQRVHTARIGVRPRVQAELVIRQDDEAITKSLPPTAAGGSVRAAIAAGHELAWLAATLAFFRSRSSSSLAATQIGRLRA